MVETPCLRGFSKCLVVMAAAMAAALAIATPAVASEPRGPFAVFAQCPRFSEGVNFCFWTQVESGEVRIGSASVPITNTITLQGGYERNEEGTERFVGALNGETLSRAPEPVPGGLLGLMKCNEVKGEQLLEKLERGVCKALFESKLAGKLTAVNAVTELAGPASAIEISSDNLINEDGVALSLPVRVHLENPLLGSNCYIGSTSSPVLLNLTTGTTSPPPPNEPIAGKFGEFRTGSYEGLTYTEIANDTLVDNSFSVPTANGCGGVLSFLVDPLVDARLGLPSAAGHNAMIQTGRDELTLAEHVVDSEQ
jgi:hypothetical protein